MDTDRILGAAQQVGGKVQEVVGRATGDHGMRAEGLVDEARGGARALYGQAKDGLRGAADAAADYAGLAQDRLEAAAHAVSDSARQAYDGGRHAVRGGARGLGHGVEEHPLAGLMVAGTVGYLLGVLVHMRR